MQVFMSKTWSIDASTGVGSNSNGERMRNQKEKSSLTREPMEEMYDISLIYPSFPCSRSEIQGLTTLKNQLKEQMDNLSLL
jgi:hypothetical protein